MTDIDWEKIAQKPEKEYKDPGEFLLGQRATLEAKDQEVSEQSLTIKHLTEQLETSKNEAETRGNKVKEMIEKYGEMNVQFEELNAKNEEMSQKLGQLEEEKQKLEDQLNTLKANNELQDDLSKEKDEELIRFSDENAELKQKISELEEQISSLPKQDEFEEFKKKYEDYPSPEELEELKRRPDPDQVDNLLINKDEEIEKLSEELQKLKEIHENLTQNFENLMTENENLKSELDKGKVSAKIPVSKPISKVPVTTTTTPPHIAPKTIHDIKPPAPQPTPKTSGVKFSFADESTAKFAYSSETVGGTKKDLPEAVVNIFENIKMAIQGGIRAGELCKLLEDSRDEIANKIGFSSALKAMGDVARKLRKAPQQAKIDDASVQVFIQKIDEWRHTMEGG